MRPAPEARASAWVWSSPLKSGTVTCRSTPIFTRTSVPASTVDPERGFCSATTPARPLTALTSTLPSSTNTRFASVASAVASLIDLPTRLGTVAGSGPSETQTVMVSSRPTILPASGSVLMVNPAAISGEYSTSVTTFVNPA